MEGWIKLHRKFIEWEWFDISDMIKLFMFLLLSANHKDSTWRGVEIKRGQYLTGLNSLSEKTKISVQTLRTCLKRLEKTGEINSKVTNKYRLITVCNYDSYQDNQQETNSQTNNQLTSKQQATNNKQEYKNINKEKKYTYKQFYSEQLEISENDKMYQTFISWLYGDNIFKRPLNSVLKMEQVSWKQFPELLKIHKQSGVKVKPLLEDMENWLMSNPKAKNKTVLGTLRTFVKNQK